MRHSSNPPVPFCWLSLSEQRVLPLSLSLSLSLFLSLSLSRSLALSLLPAQSTGENATLAAKFKQRAEWIQSWYLANLWSDEAEFLGVYKQGAEFTSMGGCTVNTR